MQVNLLKNLVDEMAGPESGQIVFILFDKKDVNEFLIAKKMNMTINQIRNILYKLSAEGLVSFSRKKDKRKGWYIYFWTLNIDKCLQKIESELVKKIVDLKQLLRDKETKRYYECKSCNIEVTEETALENDFSCEECAEVYTVVDNTNSIKEVKGRITRKENELASIRKELGENKEKRQKKEAKVKKKEDKKKLKKKDKKKLKKNVVKKLAKKVKKLVKKKIIKKRKW